MVNIGARGSMGLREMWIAFTNPKGIESFSPGLRGTSYPG